MLLFLMGVLRRWWLIFLVTLVTVIVGTLPRSIQYQADAKILFKVGREYLYQPETGDRGSPIASTSGVKNAINGESQILNSRNVKAEALERYGLSRYLDATQMPNEDGLFRFPSIRIFDRTDGDDSAATDDDKLAIALEALTSNLQIKTIENTSILQLTLKDSTPDGAESVLQELIEVFLKTRQKIYDDTNTDVMSSKLESVTRDLDDAENQLLEFNSANDIYSLDDQQQTLVQQNLALSQQDEKTQATIVELTTRLMFVNERLAETPETVSIFKEQQANKLVEEAKGRLFELELEQKRLLAAFREDSQTVARIRGEIEAVRSFIEGQEASRTETERTGRNDVFDKLTIDKLNIESELSAAKSRAGALVGSLARIDSQLSKIDKLRTAQRRLERNIQTLETRRQGYQEKVEDANLIGDLSREQRTNARIIQDPTASPKPVGLGVMQRFLLSLALGLFGGLLFASALELFQRRGSFVGATKAEIGRDDTVLDVPILATIGSK